MCFEIRRPSLIRDTHDCSRGVVVVKRPQYYRRFNTLSRTSALCRQICFSRQLFWRFRPRECSPTGARIRGGMRVKPDARGTWERTLRVKEHGFSVSFTTLVMRLCRFRRVPYKNHTAEFRFRRRRRPFSMIYWLAAESFWWSSSPVFLLLVRYREQSDWCLFLYVNLRVDVYFKFHFSSHPALLRPGPRDWCARVSKYIIHECECVSV